MSLKNQSAILQPAPLQARFITFRIESTQNLAAILSKLASHADGNSLVVGLGSPVTDALGVTIAGLKPFADFSTQQQTIPASQQALWCWLRGEDLGVIAHNSRHLTSMLAPAFSVVQVVDAFRHRENLDLTGYEDGTENPVDDEAVTAALIQNAGSAQDGSSLVAVQQWQHDFMKFDALSAQAQDHSFGRRRSDNEELDDAPESAHVKRTAQENFDPEAFLVRRSMPWVDKTDMGFMFVAFGHSLSAFEAQLNRMSGAEDGIVDAIFQFTQPLTGGYYWCPPMRDHRGLNLDALFL